MLRASDTTIAYMYDLCLKRLTRKAKLQQAKQRAVREKESSKQQQLKQKIRMRKSSAAAGGGQQGEGEEDPHWLIQRVLLNSAAMPALRYFISTYSPTELGLEEGEGADRHGGGGGSGCGEGGNTWRLVLQKKLPCSTDSYLFFVYQRVPLPI